MSNFSTKESYKEGVIITFINASKILHNAKIKSLYISENKQSAEVVLESETKFLLERRKLQRSGYK